MIMFKHTRTGEIAEVETPEEKAAQIAEVEFRDRVRRRQIQLIAKLDASAKWERTSIHDDASAPAPKTPSPDSTLGQKEAARGGASPDEQIAADGPKFTRVVTTAKSK